MFDFVTCSLLPLAVLLGSAAYTLWVAYQLGDWRPVLFVIVLLMMALHQANEVRLFLQAGPEAALKNFGEYPETMANLLASLATVLLLRFVKRERRLSNRLEELVEERTAELESFTYSVSHDLRTPLRAIDGYTQILEKNHAEALDDDGRRLLRLVSEHTQRMGTLIDDLLTLSRLGRRDMEWGRVDMEALARETFATLSETEAVWSEACTFEVQSLPDAYGDRSMLRHVFNNLFSNALKFTKNTTVPEIKVGALQKNGTPAFFVRDNGVGFNEKYADKLFGVFERLHDDVEGTGVGLAVVERIVNRHGGTVWAESTKGNGATIYFTLPKSGATNDE